jgi:molybdenum cofactor biosynthesis enzyme MoaA
LAVEGEYYAETYGLTGEENMYILEKESKTFTDEQIDDIVSICSNVRRIEFYGGEPLLDKQLPRLLQKLIDVGYASNITINVSTNCTQELTDNLVNILNSFKSVNFNLSIDGWEEKFSYIRHPGDWNFVYKNILKFIRVAITGKTQIKLLPVITVTSMNVYYLPELVENLKKKFRLTPFMIIARLPDHFSIRHIPEPIAQEIVAKLKAYTDYDFSSIVKLLDAPADPIFWISFKKWIGIMDEYRKENFVETFPEYTDLIRKHDPEFLL